MHKVLNRMRKPTPLFFKKLRNTGITIAAVCATVLTAPIALPAVLVKVAGYLTVAATIACTVSQAAVRNDR